MAVASTVKSKIPSLDGLRALSIIMVIAAHGQESLPEFVRNNFLFQLLTNSQLGVRIFFVISGYLITILLMQEREKTQTISLKKFYIRRLLRIFPVFYLYIVVISLINYFSDGIIFNWDILLGALFLMNMKASFESFRGANVETHALNDPRNNGYWFVGHFWSLALEEQFYLCWPLIIKKIKSKANLIKVCLGILLIMPALRVSCYFVFPAVRGQIDAMIFTGSDTIITGCLIALLQKSQYWDRILKLILNNWLILFCAVYMFYLSPLLQEKFRGGYYLTVGITLTNITSGIFMIWSIFAKSLWFRILNTKAAMTIGVLSYSLYIWQQLFLNISFEWMNVTIFNYKFVINQFPQNYILAIIVTCISYYLYEKKFLKLKDKFMVK